MAKPNLTFSPPVWRARTQLPLTRLAGFLALAGLLTFIGLFSVRLGRTQPEAALVVERIGLPTRELLVAQVRNTGSEPLTIAQVQVDSAYWMFTIEPGQTLAPGVTGTVAVPYLWVQNELHTITLVTSTGATFSGQIASATLDSAQETGKLWLLLAGGVGMLTLGGWLGAPWLRRIGVGGWWTGGQQAGLLSSLLAGALLVGAGGLMALLVR